MEGLNLSAVIFDNDGIVLDSEPINFEAARKVFEGYGIRLLPEDVQWGIGAGSKYMSDPMEKYNLSTVTVEQLMREREIQFGKLAAGRLTTFPGFDDLIGYLKDTGIRTALASSATTDTVMTNLGIAGVAPNTFNVIVDSSAIHHKKPAPDIFLQAAKNLKVPSSECLVVEDSLAGIEAAKRAGMKVVAVASSFPKEKLIEADFVVANLRELLTLMKTEPQEKPQMMCSAASADDDPIDIILIRRGGFSDEELAMLNDAELRAVQRSVRDGLAVNNTLKRSNCYPLPRDLSFPAEKPLLAKWASGKRNVVEIGVFEGASAIIFRRAMLPKGTLHLIDPYIVVPDSGLTARPWMAKLNILRSSNGSVVWHHDYSDNVARTWSETIDLLFIDGDHSYRGTKSDWDKWHEYVAEGGIVMFHDARMGKPNAGEWDGWPGPTKVVDELFRGPNKLPKWGIVEETGSLVVVEKIIN